MMLQESEKLMISSIQCLISTTKNLLKILEDGYAMNSSDPDKRKKYLETIELSELALKDFKKDLREEVQLLNELMGENEKT